MTRPWPCRSSNRAASAMAPLPRESPNWSQSLGGKSEQNLNWNGFCRAGARQSRNGSAEPVAQVDAAHFRVGQDLVGGALKKHFAAVDDGGAVDDVERLADVVVGDQDADAAALQIADHFADVGD